MQERISSSSLLYSHDVTLDPLLKNEPLLIWQFLTLLYMLGNFSQFISLQNIEVGVRIIIRMIASMFRGHGVSLDIKNIKKLDYTPHRVHKQVDTIWSSVWATAVRSPIWTCSSTFLWLATASLSCSLYSTWVPFRGTAVDRPLWKRLSTRKFCFCHQFTIAKRNGRPNRSISMVDNR